MKRVAALGLVGLALGCRPTEGAPARSARTVATEPPPAPIWQWSDSELLTEGRRYLGDAQFRRRTLEASLTSHQNLYAERRLNNYALGDRGWDRLPVWNPRVRRLKVGPEGAAPIEANFDTLWSGEVPQTLEAWRALGERVFFEYPVRAEAHAGFAIDDASRAAKFGLEPDAQGRWLGVVEFIDIEGREQRGITCALCHVDQFEGKSVVGRARRSLDYGKMRLAYEDARNNPVDAELRTRMMNWGHGRADVSDDEDVDPVAIPDLLGLDRLEYLTQAGTLRQVHPAALAIRQETQILHANGDRSRPPRELAWALTVFLYSLEPPEREPSTSDPSQVARGRELFERHCESCHRGPAGSGALVPARAIGSAPQLANSRARGTGKYRPAPLIDVARAAPYLHDASVGGLAELLSPKRFAEDYVVGVLGPGPVVGHAYGTELSREERDALLAFVRTL